MADFSPYMEPNTTVYSLDLEKLSTMRIERPEFPVLYTLIGGLMGRNIECFEDGPYNRFLGWEDARPVRPYNPLAQIHPIFFAKRTEDLPGDVPILERGEGLRHSRSTLESTALKVKPEWLRIGSCMINGI